MFKAPRHALKQPREWACHLRDKKNQALLMSGQKVILTFSRRGEERRRGGKGKEISEVTRVKNERP